jgi:hypothetical protein
MKNFKFFMIATLFAVTFSSCKKAVKDHEENFPHAHVNSMTTTVSNWSGGNSMYQSTVSVSFITTEIHNTGVVMCYMQDGNEWIALPITLSTGSWIEHYIFTSQVGAVNFIVYDDDGLTQNPGAVTFKIVAISSTGLAQNPDLNVLDYEQVKEVFEID